MSTKTAVGNGEEKGKGGNFKSERNPFKNNQPKKGGAPDVAGGQGLVEAIDAALKAGCAIMFGQSRDGGTLVITILDGDARHRTYCSSEEELDAAIAAMVNMYVE